MTIIKDVFSELLSMFIGDARLSAAILVIVAIAAGFVKLSHESPLVGGGLLLFGNLAIVIVAVQRKAQEKRRSALQETNHPER